MAGITKQERLKRTAFHEAGHAIAYFGVKKPFKNVTIVPGKNTLGHLEHSKTPSYDTFIWGSEEIRNWLYIP